MGLINTARVTVPLGLALALAAVAAALAPRAIEAQSLIAAQDDPVALADHEISHRLNAAVANREIEAALAAGDVELAQSFVELAGEYGIAVDPALLGRLEAATTRVATVSRTSGSFAHGLITGEPEDLAGVAGMVLGDLFVLGDIRDAAREGTRLVRGEQADELILGLSCVGLAVTAATYGSLGAAAPARAGVTLVKAARRTGRIGGPLAVWINRSVREVVDWSTLRRTFAAASITEPALAVRGIRDAVKVDKAQGLVGLVGDVGRVQTKAGTQAALDGLKLAEGPREMSRVARLAAAKGGKTRAILKLAGRGAIMLTAGLFDLAIWVFSAALSVIGFVASLKRTAERMTERYCARRRRRRAREVVRASRRENACEPMAGNLRLHAAPSIVPRLAVRACDLSGPVGYAAVRA
jgi:hypothetical protein